MDVAHSKRTIYHFVDEIFYIPDVPLGIAFSDRVAGVL